MATFACLRVLVPPAMSARPELAALVGKFTSVFLDGRWSWPRRFETLGPSAFLLIEPRGGALDHSAMQELAQDLQLRLFGEMGAGEVSLIVFVGDAKEVARFAAIPREDLDHILAGGRHEPPFIGAATRITASGVADVPLPSERADGGDAPEVDAAIVSSQRRRRRQSDVIEPVFHGVYFTPRETFVGSAIWPRASRYCPTDGLHPTTAQAALDFDSASVTALTMALDQVPQRSKGLLYAPLCFSSLIHRAMREQYAAFLDPLPEERRAQLAAVVYDVPREPSFVVMPQLRDFLREYFGTIDLQVSDPAFAIDSLADGAANSVTFMLPPGDQATRLAAIRRFAANREHYKSRRVWFAITNVRTLVELETCCAQAIPFITGPAVTGPLDSPVGQRSAPTSMLPLRAA